MIRLRNALYAANILEELARLRLVGIAVSISPRPKTSSHPPDETTAVLRFSQTLEKFSAVLPNLSDNERSILNNTGLLELLSSDSGINTAEFYSPDNLLTLERTYEEISNLYCTESFAQINTEYKQPEPNFATPESPEKNTILIRKSAILSSITSLLIFGLILMACSTVVPQFLQSLPIWIAVDSTPTRTLTALLILILAVTGFQLITKLMKPVARATTIQDPVNVTTMLRNIFTFNGSYTRLVAGCLGPILLGFGTGISATAGFGAFAITVMLDGMYQTYDIPFWLSQLVLTIIFYVVAWRWARIPLGIGTLPALLLIGPAISFGATIAPESLSFAGNSAAFCIGTLIFAFGIAMTAAAALGPDAVTAMSLAAEERSHWSIPRSTFYFNLIPILIGIALGGNFGIATILNLLAVPVLLHYLIPPLRRFLASNKKSASTMPMRLSGYSTRTGT